MGLSAPIHQLKRRARQMARRQRLPLHEALDRIARSEGYASWSLLSARAERQTEPAPTRFNPGEMVLIGARPGQGKTLMGLRMAVDAMRAGNQSAFFTLEYTDDDVRRRLVRIGAARPGNAIFDGRFVCDSSDAICADHIIGRLSGAAAGTFAVVDYLQLLDQRRDRPPLMEQVDALRSFARSQRITLAFLSQIDRAFDTSSRPVPGREDVRLPNPLDLSLFDRAIFLHAGRVRTETF